MNFDGMTEREIVQYALENGHATVATTLQNAIAGYGFTKSNSATDLTNDEYIAEQELRSQIDKALKKASE